MSAKILVAYQTRLVPEFVPDPATLVPPKTMTKDDTIAKWRIEAAATLEKKCLQLPYCSTFERLEMVDLLNQRKKSLAYRAPGGDKIFASLVARSWLLEKFPDAWPNSLHASRKPDGPAAIFIGFNPRLFLKIMGHDCSLPRFRSKAEPDKLQALPISMWIGNVDHRDIESLVMEDGNTWDTVLKARGLSEKYRDWKGPGQNAAQDLSLITELSAQLGLLSED